jgi:hypothetical protein
MYFIITNFLKFKSLLNLKYQKYYLLKSLDKLALKL